MEKTNFSAVVKIPGIKKGAIKPADMDKVGADANVFHITIKGTFNAKEAATLEALLKSWHNDKKQ